MKKVTSKKELYKIIEHLFSSCFFEGILLLYIGQYRITVNKFITLTKIIMDMYTAYYIKANQTITPYRGKLAPQHRPI